MHACWAEGRLVRLYLGRWHGDALPPNSGSITMVVMRRQVLPSPDFRLGRDFLLPPQTRAPRQQPVHHSAAADVLGRRNVTGIRWNVVCGNPAWI